MGGKTETCTLAWHGQDSVMGEFLRQMHLQHDLTDVTFVSDDDIFTPAHALVLSACSPFLASILKSESTSPTFITVTSCNSSHIQALLTLLYCGEVVVSKDNLGQIETLAEQLQISCLRKDREILNDIPEEVDMLELTDHEVLPFFEVLNNSEPLKDFNSSPRMDLLKTKLTDLIKTSLRKEVENYQTFWHCLCCGKRWKVTRHNARRHMETHLPRQECEHCGETFQHRDIFIRHVKRNHGGTEEMMSRDVDEIISSANLKTNDLNLYSTQISFLTSYKMVKIEGKEAKNNWFCLVCGKSFKTKFECKRHMEVHLEGLALPCEKCNKVFGNNRALIEHIKQCDGGKLLSKNNNEEDSVEEFEMKTWEKRLTGFEKDMAALT